jgi:hypothetical protein
MKLSHNYKWEVEDSVHYFVLHIRINGVDLPRTLATIEKNGSRWRIKNILAKPEFEEIFNNFRTLTDAKNTAIAVIEWLFEVISYENIKADLEDIV